MPVRNANSHVWISAIACALALTAPELPAQLPPDVQVDRLSLRAERQIGSEEYGSALESLDEILRLQAEHDLTLPESFWFRHAVASNKAGLYVQAAESATRYVESTGRGGEHYLDALELLDVAEAAAERQATEASELAARVQEAQLARRAAAEAAVVREAEMSEVAVELAELAPEMQMVVIPAGSFRMGCLSVIRMQGLGNSGSRGDDLRTVRGFEARGDLPAMGCMCGLWRLFQTTIRQRLGAGPAPGDENQLG